MFGKHDRQSGVGDASRSRRSRLFQGMPFDQLSAQPDDQPVGVLAGIGIGWLWARRDREPGTQVYRDISNHPDDEQPSGIAVVRLDGDLFFATADALDDRMRDVIDSSSRLDGIVLDCEGINFVDSQGSAKMAEIARLAEESGLTLRLARVKPAVAATLDRDGVLGQIRPDHIHGNVYRAVQAQKAATADEANPEPT